jgi:DNA-binding FrmR family transcriptional regulator
MNTRYPLRYINLGHTIEEKGKLLARVRRIRSQVKAVERALEQEKGCAEVLQPVVAVRGAMNSLMAEVIADHIRVHVVDPSRELNQERAKGAKALIEVVQAYLK